MRSRITSKILPAFFFLLTFFVTASTVSAKGEDGKTVYAFGYATCLGDTTVYLSPIQVLDSAKVSAKTGFLVSRSDYSHQMEQAMQARFGKHYTCVVIFDTTRSKLEKTYLEIKRRTERDKSLQLLFLTAEDFKFTPLNTSTE